METREPLLRSDWRIYRGGAVLLHRLRRLLARRLHARRNSGGNAVFVSNYNRRVDVRGCHIHDIGASGDLLSSAIRRRCARPLFDYGRGHDYQAMDKTPGPKTDDYPADCTVDDCLIHRIGRDRKANGGRRDFHVVAASRCGIARSTTCRARASTSATAVGAATWSRIATFSTRCAKPATTVRSIPGAATGIGTPRIRQPRNRSAARSNLFSWMPSSPIILRNNRWRCDHGWDIDLDDGSTNFEIYNNLCLHGGMKNREGYRRIVSNNIMVGNTFHPHVWYAHSGDVFMHNIVMRPYRRSACRRCGAKRSTKIYCPNAAALKKSQSAGRDLHSLAGDPKFVDAAAGRFPRQTRFAGPEDRLQEFSDERFWRGEPGPAKIRAKPQIGGR